MSELNPPGAGEVVAGYELVRKLDDSGQGELYLAHDKKLHRHVALALLPRRAEHDAAEKAVFLQRAKAAAALNHPYIGQVLEAGEWEGRSFVALEFVRGETLEKRLAEGPLALSEALRIGSEIGEALEAAHAEKIVHGELKPSNVLLTAGDHVKVMGFGVGGRAPARDAPDPRSDIFSLGEVLYEMLAGVHPFASESSEPSPLSRYRNDVPELLEHIVRKMLSKSLEERYQLVREARNDLAYVRESAPSAAEPAGESRRARGHGYVPRRVIALASLPVLIILAAVWVFRDAAREPASTGDPAVAVLPFRNLSEDPLESDYLAQGITRAVITKLTQAGLRVTPWETARRYLHSDEPPEKIARALNADVVLVGTFEVVGDRLITTLSLIDAKSGFQSWAEELEESYQDLFRMQRRIAVGAATSLKKKLTGEEEELLGSAESRSVEAYDDYLQGSHILQEGTEEATDIAFDYFNRAVALDPGLAEAHVGLAAVNTERYYSGRGSLDSLVLAKKSFESALAINPASMSARRGLILLSLYEGRTEASLIQGREAERLGRATDVETLLTRAQAYSFGGLNDRSLPLFRRILEIDPLNQAAHWNLVLASFWAGEFDQAVEAGNAYSRQFGDDEHVHTKVAHSYFVLGAYDQALEHYEKVTGLAMPLYLDPFVFAGLLVQRMGDPDRAEAVWRKGIAVAESRLETYPDNVRMRLFLTMFHALVGDRASFAAEYKQVLDAPDWNAFELYYLAAAQVALGETEQAIELLRRTVRQGRVSTAWKSYIRLVSPPALDSKAFEELLEEAESEERRMRERY